jgi:hypothetical protein
VSADNSVPAVIIVLQNLRTPSMETLRELADLRYTVFDVLSAFFANNDTWVTFGRLFFLAGWCYPLIFSEARL